MKLIITGEMDDLEQNPEIDYTTFTDNGTKRRIYKHMQLLKPGDKIIGYETSPIKKVKAILEVSKSIYTNEENQEVFDMKLVEYTPTQPSWETGEDPIDHSFSGTHEPTEFNNAENGDPSDYDESDGYAVPEITCMELRVQDRPDPTTGAPRYMEMRIYGIIARHTVNVMRDGEHGKSKSVSVVGGLTGIYTDDEYSDVVVFPIIYEAAREVPFFRRERFLRESVIIIIDGVYVTNSSTDNCWCWYCIKYCTKVC